MRAFIKTTTASNFSNKKSLNTCYLEGELITLKVKPHSSRQRPHPKIIDLGDFAPQRLPEKSCK
jgi:hypothetical protein